MIDSINILLFRVIYDGATSHPLLAMLGIFLATMLPYFLIAILLYYEGIVRRFANGRVLLLRLLVAPAAALALATMMKHLIEMPRPYAALSDVVALAPYTDALATFPSMHTMVFAALGMLFYRNDHAMGKWFLLGGALIGLGRIMVGVHWPIDVFAGYAAGCAVGYATDHLERFVDRTRMFASLRKR